VYTMIRLSVFSLIVALLVGCSAQDHESRLGPPPSTYVLFDGEVYHLIDLQPQNIVQFRTINQQDGHVLDQTEGSWKNHEQYIYLTFQGADEELIWSLRSEEGGYQLTNMEAIEFTTDVEPLFTPTSQFSTALRLYDWELAQANIDGETHSIETSSLYTFKVINSERYAIRADCNLGGGQYSFDKAMLTVKPGMLTRAMCPPESLSDRYLSWLQQSHTLAWGDSYHQIVFQSKNGQLIFNANHVNDSE